MNKQQFQFEFRRYQRRFRQPLRTSHGFWAVREGIILRLQDEAGRIDYGEIAPLAWFGSECIDDAIEFCQILPAEITSDLIFEIPDSLPACQFGFETGMGLAADLRSFGVASPPDVVDASLSYSGLLSSGNNADQEWEKLWYQGYRTFKLKIGVAPLQEELTTVKTLLRELPQDVKLRLDANGGLTETETQRWLENCETFNVEFLEQPLPIEKFEAMLELSYRYATPIALDESVATIAQLKNCYDRGWRGIFVIKPAIAGSPTRLRQFCKTHAIDTVFSSVFETAIARQAGLTLAAELSDRAVGYGTTHWFDDLVSEDFEALWQSL